MRDHLRRARFCAWLAVYDAIEAISRAQYRADDAIRSAIRRAHGFATDRVYVHIDWTSDAELHAWHERIPF